MPGMFEPVRYDFDFALVIRRILNVVRAQKRTVTIICPIVRTYIDSHPEYEALVDPTHPGVMNAGRR